MIHPIYHKYRDGSYVYAELDDSRMDLSTLMQVGDHYQHRNLGECIRVLDTPTKWRTASGAALAAKSDSGAKVSYSGDGWIFWRMQKSGPCWEAGDIIDVLVRYVRECLSTTSGP